MPACQHASEECRGDQQPRIRLISLLVDSRSRMVQSAPALTGHATRRKEHEHIGTRSQDHGAGGQAALRLTLFDRCCISPAELHIIHHTSSISINMIHGHVLWAAPASLPSWSPAGISRSIGPSVLLALSRTPGEAILHHPSSITHHPSPIIHHRSSTQSVSHHP